MAEIDPADLERMLAGPEEQQPISEMALGGVALFEMFQGFLAGGFTEEQALKICALVVANSGNE